MIYDFYSKCITLAGEILVMIKDGNSSMSSYTTIVSTLMAKSQPQAKSIGT